MRSIFPGAHGIWAAQGNTSVETCNGSPPMDRRGAVAWGLADQNPDDEAVNVAIGVAKGLPAKSVRFEFGV
ncbi:hypothetical protein QF050_001777 [Arthrobacter sp. SLBN-112]|nr:hypothetical protein [Arthrobacter sp. SLBN-112]